MHYYTSFPGTIGRSIQPCHAVSCSTMTGHTSPHLPSLSFTSPPFPLVHLPSSPHSTSVCLCAECCLPSHLNHASSGHHQSKVHSHHHSSLPLSPTLAVYISPELVWVSFLVSILHQVALIFKRLHKQANETSRGLPSYTARQTRISAIRLFMQAGEQSGTQQL